MFLGIEIGGTKLQLGVGAGDGSPLEELRRYEVDRERGAGGIRERIEEAGQELLSHHEIDAIGVGFGGPLDACAGTVITSHQIDGWENFPLVRWCETLFQRPTAAQNDADAAGLAEALFGAGKDSNPVFYLTVGSGIGGGLILNGEVYRGFGLGAVEVGHLRPGLQAIQPEATVESLASGWGITNEARARLSGESVVHPMHLLDHASGHNRLDLEQQLRKTEESMAFGAEELLARCDNDPDKLNTKIVAQAAAEGNPLAKEVLEHSRDVLAWAIAQAVTLLAPQCVVIGGGVALIGESLFFQPLRESVARYVFPPFAGKFRILPAEVGEEVVVQGALALAKRRHQQTIEER